MATIVCTCSCTTGKLAPNSSSPTQASSLARTPLTGVLSSCAVSTDKLLYDPAGADLFSQTLTPQTHPLAANHEVDGIEFFPRYFGHEEQRRGLSDPRECAQGGPGKLHRQFQSQRQAALTILGSGPPPTNNINQVPATLVCNGGTDHSGDGKATTAQISAPAGAASGPRLGA